MTQAASRTPPARRPRWRPRVPAGWGSRPLAARVVLLVLGSFVLGYLFTWAVFFPGWGRDSIVTVPDLRGRPLSAATGVAEDAGLKVERGSTVPNPRIPAGAVLAQVPMPGQEATRGATVRVILSGGAERHPVPSVKGLAWKDAAELLQRYGFTVRVTHVLNPAPEGRIVRMVPEAGAVIPENQPILMTVSAGPPKVAAPGVTGVATGEAARLLEAAGLRLGKVTYDSTAGGVAGNVVGQWPAAGDSIRQGGAVAVTVSGVDPNPPPPPADTVAPPPVIEPEPAEPAPAEPAPEPAPPAPPGTSRGIDPAAPAVPGRAP